jgi:hypothetical protein
LRRSDQISAEKLVISAASARSSGGRWQSAARASDLPGGRSDPQGSQSESGTKYAGEPGPAGVRGENHMDPVRVDEKADPRKS